jgi:hypothetical protein
MIETNCSICGVPIVTGNSVRGFKRNKKGRLFLDTAMPGEQHPPIWQRPICRLCGKNVLMFNQRNPDKYLMCEEKPKMVDKS